MKKMKVMALVLAAALACMSLTACGGSKDSGDGTSASGNEEGKGLTVATSPDFPPFESLENNEIVGIEVDIMNLISEDLGMPVKYERHHRDGGPAEELRLHGSLLPGLSGHCGYGRQPHYLQSRSGRQEDIRPDRHDRRGVLHG